MSVAPLILLSFHITFEKHIDSKSRCDNFVVLNEIHRVIILSRIFRGLEVSKYHSAPSMDGVRERARSERGVGKRCMLLIRGWAGPYHNSSISLQLINKLSLNAGDPLSVSKVSIYKESEQPPSLRCTLLHRRNARDLYP